MRRPDGVQLLLRLGAIVALASGCNPVKADEVSALGGEAPGVRKGPTHRPGQPCLLCHDGDLGDPQRFTVAGTVFETTGSVVGASGVQVNLTDATGASISVATNEVGNFYLTPGQYSPTFPLQVNLSVGGSRIQMQTLIQGAGSTEPGGACASCHFDPAGPSSPGHVAVKLDDGGTPP